MVVQYGWVIQYAAIQQRGIVQLSDEIVIGTVKNVDVDCWQRSVITLRIPVRPPIYR
jgi:hypothetical protein